MIAEGMGPSRDGPHASPGRSSYTLEETYRATRPPVDRALTLNPDAYRSPEFYAVEQERVFSKGWVCVGYTSQVERPGDVLVATVAGQPILVTRDRSPGRSAPSTTSAGTAARCSSPRTATTRSSAAPTTPGDTAWTAACSARPYFKGLDVSEAERSAFDIGEAGGFRKEDYGLLPVRAETWGCFVFVNLDPEALPLSEWLGDLPERLGALPAPGPPVRQAQGHRRRGQLEARRRELHGVLSPALGPSRAEHGLEPRQPRALPGARDVHGDVHHPAGEEPRPADRRRRAPGMPGLDAKDAETAYWYPDRPEHRAVPAAAPPVHAPAAGPKGPGGPSSSPTCWSIPRPWRRPGPRPSSTRSSTSGTWSTPRTSRRSSGCSGACRCSPTRGGGCAIGSRSRSTASRTWSSTS